MIRKIIALRSIDSNGTLHMPNGVLQELTTDNLDILLVVAVDSSGNVYVIESSNHRVAEV